MAFRPYRKTKKRQKSDVPITELELNLGGQSAETFDVWVDE